MVDVFNISYVKCYSFVSSVEIEVLSISLYKGKLNKMSINHHLFSFSNQTHSLLLHDFH